MTSRAELQATLPVDDGRYEGDLGTRLVWVPGERHPFTVYVWDWTMHGDGDGGWLRPSPILADFSTRSFRSLERALKFRAKVQASADLGHLERVMRERTFERRAEALA